MIVATRALGGVARLWREALLLICFLVIGYQNISDTRFFLWADTIPFLQAEVVKREVELELALQSNKLLTESIERRNEQVNEQRQVTLLLQEEFAKISEEITGIRRTSNERVRTIIQEKAPETCTAAFEYLRDSIPEIRYNTNE